MTYQRTGKNLYSEGEEVNIAFQTNIWTPVVKADLSATEGLQSGSTVLCRLTSQETWANFAADLLDTAGLRLGQPYLSYHQIRVHQQELSRR